MSQIAGQQRRETPIQTASIQKMLDENVRLIHSLMAHQRVGALKEAAELERVLHRNLIYLATIADRTTTHAPPPTVSHVSNGVNMPNQAGNTIPGHPGLTQSGQVPPSSISHVSFTQTGQIATMNPNNVSLSVTMTNNIPQTHLHQNPSTQTVEAFVNYPAANIQVTSSPMYQQAFGPQLPISQLQVQPPQSNQTSLSMQSEPFTQTSDSQQVSNGDSNSISSPNTVPTITSQS